MRFAARLHYSTLSKIRFHHFFEERILIISFMGTFERTYLQNATLKKDSLEPFGFVFDGDHYLLSRDILDGEFRLSVSIDKHGEMETGLTEVETQEPYALYKVESAHGEYVGSIRDAIKAVIIEVRNACYTQGYHTSDIFYFLRDYCKNTYGEELEFLWDDENCILRRKDNQKWYAVIMLISLRKLGIEDDNKKSVLVLRGNPDEIDMVRLFPGYHLNKKSWVSIVLDERTDTSFLVQHIEASRDIALTKGKPKSRTK